MEFSIRNLETGDLNRGFLDTLSNLTTVGEIDRDRFNEIFRFISPNPHHQIFVAENDGGETIGATTLLIEQELDGAKIAHIEDVATRRGFERRGVGSALVNRALTEAEKIGCCKAVLDCSWNNVPFYKKFGFEVSGVQMRFDFKFKQVIAGPKPKNPVLHIFVDELSLDKTISVILEQKFIHGGGIVAHVLDNISSKNLTTRVSAIIRALAEAMKFGCYKTILTCRENETDFYEGIGFKKHEISMSFEFQKGGF